MVGPSSSHTAGAVRLGALTRAIFGSQPQKASVKLHGSFAATGEGHGTKLALSAGLLGLRCDDARIADAAKLAASAGMQLSFEEISLEGAHPNSALFVLEDSATGKTMSVEGSSIGGGKVLVTRIDSYEVEATGELPLLIVSHYDRPGVIHDVSEILARADINIAGMKVARERRGARALMLMECDLMPQPSIVAQVRELPNIRKTRAVPAIGF
jgi:L-serine dehydratase